MNRALIVLCAMVTLVVGVLHTWKTTARRLEDQEKRYSDHHMVTSRGWFIPLPPTQSWHRPAIYPLPRDKVWDYRIEAEQLDAEQPSPLDLLLGEMYSIDPRPGLPPLRDNPNFFFSWENTETIPPSGIDRTEDEELELHLNGPTEPPENGDPYLQLSPETPFFDFEWPRFWWKDPSMAWTT